MFQNNSKLRIVKPSFFALDRGLDTHRLDRLTTSVDLPGLASHRPAKSAGAAVFSYS